MPATPLPELQRRLSALQDGLAARGLNAALIVQNVDLFYFTATSQNAHLFVPAAGYPLLLVRKDLDRARAESPLENIYPLTSLKELPALLQEHGYRLPAHLGLELDVLPAGQYLSYRKLFPATEIADVSPLIREVRSVKSPFELELMRAAAQATDGVFAAIPSLVRVDMSEVELAGLVEALFRKAGHHGLVRMRGFNQELFYGALLSGANMAVPSCVDSPTGGPGMGPDSPLGAGPKPIGRDEPLMVDYTGAFHGYLIDQTRLFVTGKLPSSWRQPFKPPSPSRQKWSTWPAPGVRRKNCTGKPWGWPKPPAWPATSWGTRSRAALSATA